MATTRIINRAATMVAEGVSPGVAIERACAQVSTSSGARDMARRIFRTAMARAAAEIGAWR